MLQSTLYRNGPVLSTADVLATIADDKRTAEFREVQSADPNFTPPLRHKPAAMTLEDAVRMVRENATNIHFVREVVEALGGYDVVRKAKPRPAPVDLPLSEVWAVEVSLGHIVNTSGPKKKTDKPTRPDQAAAKHRAVVQAWFTGTQTDFSNPDWYAEALLFEPKRAIAVAKKQKRCSQAYKDWIEKAAAPFALASGYLIGMLYISHPVDYPGTNYYDGHIVLVPREAINDPTSKAQALVMKVNEALRLPAFHSKTATGKSLGGSFFRQARGLLEHRAMRGWNAGPLEYLKS